MRYETMRQPAAAEPRNGEFMILEIVQRTCVISSGSDTPAPEGAPNRNAELTVNQ